VLPRSVDHLRADVIANIRAHASQRNVPLSLLADFAGVSRAHFFDVLAGRKDPTLTWLAKVAAALGIDVSDLLTPAELLRP